MHPDAFRSFLAEHVVHPRPGAKGQLVVTQRLPKSESGIELFRLEMSLKIRLVFPRVEWGQ